MGGLGEAQPVPHPPYDVRYRWRPHMPFDPTGDVPAGRYRLSIFKYRTVAPEKQWVNSYDLRFNALRSFQDTLEHVFDFVNFERKLHLNSVTIDRAVLSTFAADSTPYNANEFLSVPVTLVCLRIPPGDPLPLEIVVLVRKAVATGRAGKLLYRGCLAEGEVSAPSGTIQFSSGAFFSVFNNALADVSKYLAADPPYFVELIMGGSNAASSAQVIRTVAALQLVSPRIRSRSARWYNRRPPQAG